MEKTKALCMLLVILLLGVCVESQLSMNYYASTCPGVEGIVRSTVQSHYNSDPTIAPGLLRLHFHDCFVQSGGPSWGVPLGRLDGKRSSASDAVNLPSPLESIAVHRKKFADKGLDDHDLVTLVGAHTIGQTDCRFFQYRLYNFTPTGNSDPSMNQAVLAQLQTLCPKNGNGLTKVALDKDSWTKFDVNFFKNVRDGNAVLESDQRLWGDDVTRQIVQNYAGNIRGLFGVRFNFDFPKAMVKMSSIDVKTDYSSGEVRTICSKFN